MNLFKTYITANKQFILIGIVWLVVGIYISPLIYFLLPAMILLMYSKQMHLEILLGFFLVLTLSDSRLYQLSFAANAKNIYIVLLFLISIKEMKYMENVVNFYRYFIPFFLIAILCMFFNPNVTLSFQKTLSYLLIIISVPNYFLFIYQKNGVELLKSIVFLGSVILGLGLIINLLNSDITNLVGRYRGLLGNPNGLGLYSFLFILFFATLNEHKPDLFSRSEKLAVYGLAFFSLLKCGARTSLVTTLMFFFFKKFYKISPWLGFFIFIIISIGYQLISSNLTQIIITLGLGEQFRVQTLENGSGRAIAWEFAWVQIQDNFFLGKGFSYTEYIYFKNYEYLSMLGHQGAAHNSYLTLWLDTGLVGLTAFMVAILILFLKLAQSSRLAIPVLFSVLFSNNYESWLTASLNPFTIQLLFILTVISMNSSLLKKQEKLAI